MILPNLIFAPELARELRMSERGLKEWARSLGIGRRFGKKFAFTDADIQVLLEDARPCHLKSGNAAKYGTTPERLPESDYEEVRARLIRRSRSKSLYKKNKPHGNVVLMAKAQG